ncbi:hypothetical protein SEA_ARTORIAS_44 [Gordonia phage Artorias]|nr:hypothetical protein SEA_ARTORIAS_44 [Gordonia phage Artorias]
MLDKVKKHVQDNKKYYLVGGVVVTIVAAGTTGYILGTKTSPKEVMNQISPKQQGFVVWKPTQTLEVYIEACGDPGNIIQDLTTGTIYASQNQAAAALGVDKAAVSRHLKGLSNHVGDGHVLQKLGKAHVTDLA